MCGVGGGGGTTEKRRGFDAWGNSPVGPGFDGAKCLGVAKKDVW